MKKLYTIWTAVFGIALCNILLLGRISTNQERVLRISALETKYSVGPESILCLSARTGDNVGNKEFLVHAVSQEDLLHSELLTNMTEQDISILERIVEAEAGGEDQDGKLLVANVVLNRVSSEDFPDTVEAVVFQKSKGVTQFSPVSDGRYDSVTVSEDTVEAVKRALGGEDISQGALYFAARKIADKTAMKWFDEQLTYLFVHGGHEFFR